MVHNLNSSRRLIGRNYANGNHLENKLTDKEISSQPPLVEAHGMCAARAGLMPISKARALQFYLWRTILRGRKGIGLREFV